MPPVKKVRSTEPKKSTQSLVVELAEAIKNASPEERAMIGSVFPNAVQNRPASSKEKLELHRMSAREEQGALNARLVVEAVGSVSHSPGFEPMPPEHVAELGEEAVEQWLLDWYEGRAGRSFDEFRREWGSGNADKAEEIVNAVEESADAIAAGTADGILQESGQSYLGLESSGQ